MKVAVIGSGISGLSAAYAMRTTHDVHVFESEGRPGGHAHTVTIHEGNRDVAVDTGFIVYNEATYPGFTSLLAELDVPTIATEMSFGMSCATHNLEYSSRGLAGMFAQPRAMATPSRAKMIWEIRRFYREATALLNSGPEEIISLGEFLDLGCFGEEFRRHFLSPLVGAIWSTPATGIPDYPARYLFEFLHNHGLLGTTGRLEWRTVVGGSKAYVDRLIGRLPNGVRLNSPIQAIHRDIDGVSVIPWSGNPERFDHVVFATHADQSLRLLRDHTLLERQALSSLVYEPSRVVLHSDEVVMPRRRRAWAGWNYSATSCMADAGPVSISYHMNRLQKLDAVHDYFVSMNPSVDLAAERIIAEFDYAHPQYSVLTQQAQEILRSINGANRTHFAGAFLGHGFHEDGFKAGLDVALQLQGVGLTVKPSEVAA